MTNEQPDRLDLILNAAMREYSNAEPRAGIEQRILRHVQTRPHRRPRWTFAWAMVVAAIAVILLIALPARRISLPRLALLAPPVPQAARPVIPASLPPRRTSGRRSLRRSQEPKPLPLTAEEQALLRFVQEQPGLAEAVLARPTELEALTIEPLKIEELHLP
jgi:hypothetical protein